MNLLKKIVTIAKADSIQQVLVLIGGITVMSSILITLFFVAEYVIKQETTSLSQAKLKLPSVQLLNLGNLTVTSYRPIQKQTDKSPTWTAIGDRTTRFGVAVSQDLLKSGAVKYGDILYIKRFGQRVVNDCMHKRKKNSIDLLVFTHKEEVQIGTRYLTVYKVQIKEK